MESTFTWDKKAYFSLKLSVVKILNLISVLLWNYLVLIKCHKIDNISDNWLKKIVQC